MADELVESLKRVPIFAGVRDKELGRLVKAMRDSRFNEGEVITTEGRSGVGFFLIEDGNATVSLRGEIVRTLGPGDHFGEIALIDEGPRSATVTATTDLRCRGLENFSFLRWEKRIIRAAIDEAVPVLGICLGAQLIASALGTAVFHGPVKEIGWSPISITPHGQVDSLLVICPRARRFFNGTAMASNYPSARSGLRRRPITALKLFASAKRFTACSFISK